MGQQPDIFSDPHAGTPLRGDLGRVMEAQAEDDPRFTDPRAGEPLRVQTTKTRLAGSERTLEEFPVVNLARGAWNVVKELPAATLALARDLPPGLDADGSVHFPLEQSIRGLAAAHLDTGTQAVEAFKDGDYITAARKAMNALVPLVGPALDAADDKIMHGDVAEGIGEAGTHVLLTALGTRPRSAPVAGAARGPRNPVEAAAVEFARQEGIPLDAGTATGSQFVKNLQKKAASSWGGASTVEAAQAAQGDALAAAAERLARRANNGGPAVGAVEAGEGVRAALENRVRGFHSQANRAYTEVRNAEAAAPEEFVQVRPEKPAAAAHVTPEQNFLLRWMAKDLEDFTFESGGTTRAARRRAYESFDPIERDALYHNPRVAGTPVQEMFHALGVKGSRPEIAARIEKFLRGENKDPRFAKLADVLNEAFDGQRFDWDLVSDESLTALGVRKRDLKSPMGLPDFAEPGAAAFFPDEAIPAAPSGAGSPGSGATAMRLAIDLKPHKEALRPLFDQLQKEREITGTLHGDRARAAVALEALINGPDFAPMSTVEAALGPVKKLARVGDMPQLRTQGQGLASRVVGELDTAVRGRAQDAGPNVAQALSEGRAATRMKHMTADVMKKLTPVGAEPVSVFKRLTANKDAGIAKLRELQKQTPDQMPQIARALLEDIFEKPTSQGGFKFADGAWARWQKLGPESKAILFPDRGHRVALDQFFLLAKRINENPNPSGTAQVMNATNVIAGIPMYALAKVLYSPAGVRALTGVMDVSVRRPAAVAARTAALAQLTRAAREVGVTLEGLPKAATKEVEREPQQ